ncbi:MAG: MerR family transcriptional regulator [Candidatus Aminicenantes bacterium]
MKDQKAAQKLAYKLEEISQITHLDPGIINSWEKEFYFLNAGETSAGVKIFRKKDLDIILRLKDLVEKEGLTLAGAKRKIEKEFGIKKSSYIHPDRLKKTLTRVRDQLTEIVAALEK